MFELTRSALGSIDREGGKRGIKDSRTVVGSGPGSRGGQTRWDSIILL